MTYFNLLIKKIKHIKLILNKENLIIMKYNLYTNISGRWFLQSIWMDYQWTNIVESVIFIKKFPFNILY